jgi:uncharacterized protein
MVPLDLVQVIIDQHKLKTAHSIHFVDHWARVLENGRKLVPLTGARLDVVELFAVFHDAGRQSDGHDHNHGRRGAEIARAMQGVYFTLDPEGLDLLFMACAEHTYGEILADVTVQTCWDSDRLDLGRAGYTPSPQKLCTPPARTDEMITWANERSIKRFIPDLVWDEWGLIVDSAGNFSKK